MPQGQEKSLELLVIDDDAGVVEVFGTLLKYIGNDLGIAVSVTGCSTARGGISEYDSRLDAEKPYDGVITDLNLPDLDGEHVLLHVKNKSQRTPVYIVTGYQNEYEKLKAKHGDKGPDGGLIKPVDEFKLKPVIEEIALRKYGQQKPYPNAHPHQS